MVYKYQTNFNDYERTAGDAHSWIMSLPDLYRGTAFSALEATGWKWNTTPRGSTFWAYFGWKLSGNNSQIYNKIMQTDDDMRYLAFTYLQRTNWDTYGGRRTFWADLMWQYLADLDRNQKIA